MFRNDPLYHAREIWDERCAGCHGAGRHGRREGPRPQGLQLARLDPRLPRQPRGRRSTWARRRSRRDEAGRGDARGDRRADRVRLRRDRRAPTSTRRRPARGRDLLSPKDCDTCHDFDGEGENDGPNLKGRGTLAWVEASSPTPASRLLFGDKNKMPKFAGKLTPEEIDQMTTFVLALKGK